MITNFKNNFNSNFSTNTNSKADTASAKKNGSFKKNSKIALSSQQIKGQTLSNPTSEPKQEYIPLNDASNYSNQVWFKQKNVKDTNSTNSDSKRLLNKKSTQKYLPKMHCSTVGCNGLGHVSSKFTTHYR